MRALIVTALVAGGLWAAPLQADPVVGAGLTFWFGQGQTKTAIGFKILSDDENESVVGTLGVDYVFGGGGVQPNIGLAYLKDDLYVGVNAGLNLSGGPIEVGLGVGATNTADPAAAPVLTAEPVEPGGGPET